MQRFITQIIALLGSLILAGGCFGQVAGDGWVLLGSITLNMRAGRQSIELPATPVHATAIRLLALDGAIQLERVTVAYANGQSHFEDRPINLRRGETTSPINPRDEALHVDEVSLTFQGKSNGGAVTLQIWGKPPPPKAKAVVDPPDTGLPAGAKGYQEMTVLFATTRRHEGNKLKAGKPLATFSGEEGAKPTFGRAFVTVPVQHRAVGTMPRPAFDFVFKRLGYNIEDPKQHFTIGSVEVVDTKEFGATLHRLTSQAKHFKNQALVFVHGYNVAFDDALFRTAQLAHDIGFDGPAMTFSWPSRGAMMAYVHDKDNATANAAREALRDALMLIARDPAITGINLVAHSMGNVPVLEMLALWGEIRRSGGNAADLKLKEIVFAAPDVTRSDFEAKVARYIAQATTGITLYASDNDRAMMASKSVSFKDKAGFVPANGPVIVRGVETIDVSKAGTMSFFILNHSLYAEREPLLVDMKALFASNTHPPGLRSPLFIAAGTPPRQHWRYEGK